MAKPAKWEALYQFDAAQMAMHKVGFTLCGVDEAGRGPLCGPVSVGAVILRQDEPIQGLDDSKKLSESKREILYDEIIAKAQAWQVVLVPPDEIDRLNILGATMFGMKQAVEGLSIVPDVVLVDGNKMPDIHLHCQCVTKGDAQSAAIAAASILAKVTRDRFMCKLHEDYPQYELARHKGYPTKLHYELLAQHGVQPFYRQTFLKSFYKSQEAANSPGEKRLRGDVGENFAAKTYEEDGYRIVEKNFRTRFGEVDFIAEKNGVWAFVEVKTRAPGAMVSGAQAVDKKKQARVIHAALEYCAIKRMSEPFMRFDVVEVVMVDDKVPAIERIENAFGQ